MTSDMKGEDMAPLQKNIQVVEGHRVFMTQADTGEKPLLVLTRMAAGGMGMWDSIWPYLSEHFTVANVELPAPSLDEYPSSGALFSFLAQRVVLVAKALGHEKFHLFGWTGGAQVALRCLVEHPESLLSCIVLGPSCPGPDPRPVNWSNKLLSVVLDEGGLELYTYLWLVSGMSADNVENRFDEVEAMVKVRLEVDEGRLDSARVMKWIDAIRGQVATAEELAQVRTPVFIAAPVFDASPTLPNIRRLAAAIPTAELGVINGAGALVMIDEPEKFMLTAGDFLRRAAQGQGAPAKAASRGVSVMIEKGRRAAVVEREEGRALVCLHGWLMSPQMWAHSLKALEGRMRAVALWQPGHGPSSAAPHGFTMDDWSAWLVGCLDELGVEKALLAGHSMGGMLVMNTARLYPQRVEGLVLVGTQDTPWSQEEKEEFAQAMDTVSVAWGPEIAPQVADFLMGKSFLKRHPAWVGSWAHEVGTYDLSGIANLGPAINGRPDLSGFTGQVNYPVLVAHGEVDEAIDISIGRRMHQRIPGAIFKEMEGAAHCPPLETPEAFTQALVEFLGEKGFIS